MFKRAFTTYRSTRNTRIERLWVEVGGQFARQWWAFFFRLEELHDLRRADPRHLWLLHYLFLAKIDDDCQTFRKQYNCKPIGGLGHEQSPLVSGGVIWYSQELNFAAGYARRRYHGQRVPGR